jgi:probable HAF family extracellular repeat protein
LRVLLGREGGNGMRAIRMNRADLTKACLVAMGIVVVALLMGAQPVSGQQAAAGQYSMTDLGTLPGADYTVALGINDRGQVVGTSFNTASGGAHAVLWEDGEITDLGVLPSGSHSRASGINNRGQIVGQSLTASGEWHAVLWSKEGR